VNEKREEQAEAEVDEKADIDSIDSLICACGSPMLMRFSHDHEVLQRS
jgi:predicted RNase H-like nuclease